MGCINVELIAAHFVMNSVEETNFLLTNLLHFTTVEGSIPPIPPSITRSTISPNFSSISSGSVIYSRSSSSSYGKVVVIIGASSRRAISRIILLSGIRMPTSFRLRKILGSRFVPFRMKVNGPGRLCFISLKTLLSTLAYSLILLKS